MAQFGRALALGQITERCLWQIQRGDLCAAVDKIEDKRKPDDFIGYRKPGEQSNLLIFPFVNFIITPTRMWLSLVERLLWERVGRLML